MAMAELQKGSDMSAPSNEQESLPKKGFPRLAPRRPTPEEMIQYYSRNGLDKQAATEKVIEDLQKALTIAVNRYPKKAQEVEKLESFSNRVSAVEAKLNDKPDLGGVFVAGVAAGGFLQAVPHVFRVISHVGQSLKDAMSSKP